MTVGKSLAAGAALLALTAAAPATDLALGDLQKIGTVSDRYQGYNIEMAEVTGGKFWAPYGGPPGERYRQLPPIDLTNPKLIALAKALGPSLLRVSGTWANNSYLPAADEQVTTPPPGFAQVLTREQWKNVVAFSRAADAPIVTSFAVSNGTRDAAGVWTTTQAQRLVDLTRALGGSLYAAEFYNEPTMPSMASDTPKDYDATRYTTDFRIFRAWARKAVPHMKILGPGGVGEPGTQGQTMTTSEFGTYVSTESLMRASPNSVDAVSYHFYGAASQRCAGLGIATADKAAALTTNWLDLTKRDYDYYAALRDKYEPGKPMWNTETAQAACGGSPWAATFLDTFRYLNQLGALAQKGAQAVLHNTLSASDYALLEPDTLDPRPNYWAAVLWRRTMGTTVLASPPSPAPDLHLFAQCLRGKPGGVAVLAINAGETLQRLSVGGKGLSWTMTGNPVDTKRIEINGQVPGVTAKYTLTGLEGVKMDGTLNVPGQAIAFAAVPGADNPACR